MTSIQKVSNVEISLIDHAGESKGFVYRADFFTKNSACVHLCIDGNPANLESCRIRVTPDTGIDARTFFAFSKICSGNYAAIAIFAAKVTDSKIRFGLESLLSRIREEQKTKAKMRD